MVSSEVIPDAGQVPVNSKTPKELCSLNKDTTNYAWYTTRKVKHWMCLIKLQHNDISRQNAELFCMKFGSSLRLSPSDLTFRKDILPIIRVASFGHAFLAFISGEYIGDIFIVHTYSEGGVGRKGQSKRSAMRERPHEFPSTVSVTYWADQIMYQERHPWKPCREELRVSEGNQLINMELGVLTRSDRTHS